MKILALYKSKHGATEKIIKLIKDDIEHNLEMRTFDKGIIYNLNEYDHIIIGGSIYYGMIQREIKDFVNNYKNDLLKMKYSLILSCGSEEAFEKQLIEAFGGDLVDQAALVLNGGHIFNFDDLSFLEKIIVKKVSKQKESINALNVEGIKNYIHQLDEVDHL